MKNSAIREMINGKRGNLDEIKYSDTYFELLDKVIELENELQKKLSPELLQLYNKVVDSTVMMHIEEIEIIYEEGFSFGLLLGIQASERFK